MAGTAAKIEVVSCAEVKIYGQTEGYYVVRAGEILDHKRTEAEALEKAAELSNQEASDFSRSLLETNIAPTRTPEIRKPAAQQAFPCDECGRGAGRGEHTKSCRQAEPAPTPSRADEQIQRYRKALELIAGHSENERDIEIACDALQPELQAESIEQIKLAEASSLGAKEE
jgi:hypothetical protein